jgi:hypothetical protein
MPVLVFDEECFFGLHQLKELFCISAGVNRKVHHNISLMFVIFSDFVTRWRKKGEQNAVFRKSFSDFFNQRTTLFKLTQRCTMHPNVACVGFNFFRQFFPPVFPAFYKLTGLFLKSETTCINMYQKKIPV